MPKEVRERFKKTNIIRKTKIGVKKTFKRVHFGLKKIENDVRSRACLSKRKKGIIKKCIQLNVLCDIDVYLVIFDKEKQKVIEYSSATDFDSRMVNHLLRPDNKCLLSYETYDNTSLK